MSLLLILFLLTLLLFPVVRAVFRARRRRRVEQSEWRRRFRAREDEIICRGIELATRRWID